MESPRSPSQLGRMSLLSLPNELLLFIAENLTSERDISAFTQTNLRLHTLLNVYLYCYNTQWGGSSALLWAAKHGQKTTAQKSLDSAADIQTNPSCVRKALFLAVNHGHEAVVELLLAEDGVDLNSKDNNGWTLLSWAAWRGHEAVVKLLLAKDGIDPNSKGSFCGWTPLICAAMYGHEAVVKLLLTTDGVDLNFKDHNGWTPLSWASQHGHEGVVKLLLSRGNVYPESKENGDQTPLL